jgi:tetratricopeptide (TPR) repeat protein
MHIRPKTAAILTLLVLLNACSMDKFLVRSSIPLIEGGVEALNQETDLKLAEDSIPTNLEMLEGMIGIDPENATLHTYAAQAYYGLSYGFNEDNRPQRAVKFYRRGLKHGKQALAINGLGDIEKISIDQLEADLKKMDKDDVPALFWTAGNWAKWIDHNRNSTGLMQLPRATALMQRVLELDDTFYHGSVHIYFGVYYGGRAPMFGGNFKKSEEHFDRAREITGGKLLVADLLQAQYLSRQKLDREDFHKRLTKIIEAPDDLYPELGLLNQIAKRKARMLLNKEERWF